MHRRLFSWLLLLLLTAAAVAQNDSNSPLNLQMNPPSGTMMHWQSFNDLYAAQRVLLSNFCRLDFQGARLQPGGWQRFQPYTSIPDNPDFTRIMIVTRYDIDTPEQPTEELYVHYQTLGSYQLGVGYTAAPSGDQSEFRVQDQNGTLLVTAVDPESPHVSPQAALAWMKRLLDDPKTSGLERAHLLDAVQQLNKFLPPRPASGH